MIFSSRSVARARGVAWRLAAAGALLIGTTLSADAATVKETFSFLSDPATTTQDMELRNRGWCGGNAGDSFCNNPAGTIANQGGEGAISVGNGPDGTQGFAFWSQRGINADGFLYTEKHPVNSSLLQSMSWQQSDSGTDPVRLAFLVGSTWYISQESFNYQRQQPGDWELQVADIASLSFFTREQNGDILPGGGVGAGQMALPVNEMITALGFWLEGSKTGTTRIDDVELNVVPLPAAGWLAVSAFGALGVLRHRSRRRREAA